MPNYKELDRVFSIWIRRRDANECTGRVKCCTCEAAQHWAEMDAGHFIPRSNMATRWNERNVHPQDKLCNRVKDGEYEKHRDYINERYGYDAAEELERLGKTEVKFMQFEIDQMTQDYKDKIKALEL